MITAELISAMGSDTTVCNAARVSNEKLSEVEQDGTELIDRQLTERDKNLIIYLAKHNHFTPFTHCMITMRETVPIFVARQRFKHTVGFSYNEISRRYVKDTPQFYDPPFFRKAAPSIKQGSLSEPLDKQYYSKRIYDNLMLEVEHTYNELIREGVAPEQARMVLPMSTLTSYFVTGSLSAFARAYNLRSDSHAQKEIQDLALQWDLICASLYPVSWLHLTQAYKETVVAPEGF
tara:strand:+ start:3346 stop:4047 length:702 start_codon:yes stop_codon:yes gene_type:complete